MAFLVEMVVNRSVDGDKFLQGSQPLHPGASPTDLDGRATRNTPREILSVAGKRVHQNPSLESRAQSRLAWRVRPDLLKT